MPSACNVPSRTIFTGDNLDILRGINSECIDLIYLDPPFNSNQSYAAPLDSEARGAEFDDVWTLDDMKEEWIDEIEFRRPSLFHLINGAKLAHGESMAGYLTFMSVRLLELHRVLKPTGSIYLHCDDTAVHYLKGVMDALFGPENYVNNIVWKRATSHNDPKRFGRILDHLLFYSRGSNRHWNADAVTTPKDADELLKAYPSQDERGRYRSDNLTGPRHNAKRGSPSTMPWKSYDIYAMNRVWSVPKTGKYAEYIERNFIPGYRDVVGIHDRLDALDKAGLIHHPQRGVWPGLKRYAEADTGNPAQNLFLHPTGFTNFSTKGGEYTGWKTQKPVALLEQIIKASSNPGDLVLDPFCGCATACIAAEKLGREWIGIDKLPQAAEVLTERAQRELQIPLGDDWTEWQPMTLEEPPKRNDLTLMNPANPQSDRELLYASQHHQCAGCQYELPLHVLTIDHIHPRSLGGLDSLGNLQLMCHACNAIKGNRSMDYLHEQLHRRGILTI
jgi:site-specific DNA-methyltransferase (adenine-specific)